MAQDRSAQLATLHRTFPGTTCVKETSAETLLKVDHSVDVGSTKYDLSLFVKVMPNFPKSPPTVTLPYCFLKVPITPPNVSPAEVGAYSWDPSASTLVEAVRNAFQHAADRWGPVEPPTMASVVKQLNGETDRLLQDLVSNPSCLDAYCYQLPMTKKMREVGRQTVDDVEKLANENVRLRPEVEELKKEVERMQKTLSQQVDALQQVGNNKLLTSVCTPQALVQTLEGDVKRLDSERTAVGKKAISLYQSDRRSFLESLEKYKTTSKFMHLVDLKCRAYRSQM